MKLNSMTAKMFNAALTAMVLTGSVAFAQAPINRKPPDKGLKPGAATVAGAQPGTNNGAKTTPVPRTGAVTNQLCGTTSLLWDNGPFNGADGLLSVESSTPARTADDFVVPTGSGVTVRQITADMYTNVDISTPAAVAFVEIYATDAGGNGPARSGAAPLFSVPASSATVVGSGFGYSIVRFTFTSTGLPLSPGRYWVSPVVNTTGLSYFCSSNGASPDAGQISYFKYPNGNVTEWIDVNTAGYGTQPQHAFTVTTCPLTGSPENVNGQVSFTTTNQGLAGIAGSCAGLGYTNQYNLNVDLRNIGINPLTSPYFSVVELQEANGVPPANPFRLRTANDFNDTTCTGGVIGTTQAIPGPIAPNQVIPVSFQIAMPSLRRFRFIVNVFATVGGSGRNRSTGTMKMGRLTVDVTGFDKAGNPLLSATFTPEKGAPTCAVSRVSVTSAK